MLLTETINILLQTQESSEASKRIQLPYLWLDRCPNDSRTDDADPTKLPLCNIESLQA